MRVTPAYDASDLKGIVLVCAACGKRKQTRRQPPRFAVELATFAAEVGWRPLWGRNRLGHLYVQIHCSDRCAEAQITKKGTLRRRVAKLEPEDNG